MKNIRNFSIIAHIDHGKSTLADRMIEETSTVEQRDMQEQVLDQMELERERGITIKMTPVTMRYKVGDESYKLNLIDTPGHIDFSYEVSRALKAVEGVVLLVDATQGVQAQTLSTLALAREMGCKIIPAVTKIDVDYASPDEVSLEIAEYLDIDPDLIERVSGKTGEGVTDLLDRVVRDVPAPVPALTSGPSGEISGDGPSRALVFDFSYSEHRGVVVYARVFDGEIKTNDALDLLVAGESFSTGEVGRFSPEPIPTDRLQTGEIGYIVTGIKEPGVARVGDTIATSNSGVDPLPGYRSPQPVVWAGVFPESQDDFTELRRSLERLKLSDSALSFQEESSGVLGRGFRLGLLGMLHLEITTERIVREYGVPLIITSPSVTYTVVTKKEGEVDIYSPSRFPYYGDIEEIHEPWVTATIIAPPEHTSSIIQLLYEHEAEVGETSMFGDGRTKLGVRLPLRELMRGFFDDLKRVSSGYGSISYDIEDEKIPADVVLLEVLVAEEVVPAFSRVVSKDRVEKEAREIVERLYELLPRQQFKIKIQARSQGRIISSKTLGALRKNVTEGLYGGDITRKMKLREKQKAGKKRAQGRATADIPQEVFLKMLRR